MDRVCKIWFWLFFLRGITIIDYDQMNSLDRCPVPLRWKLVYHSLSLLFASVAAVTAVSYMPTTPSDPSPWQIKGQIRKADRSRTHEAGEQKNSEPTKILMIAQSPACVSFAVKGGWLTFSFPLILSYYYSWSCRVIGWMLSQSQTFWNSGSFIG